MTRVLGQVGQITFEKDLDLQVEMAVLEQLGKMGKEYFWDLREECPTGLRDFYHLQSLANTCIEHFRKLFRSCLVVLLL